MHVEVESHTHLFVYPAARWEELNSFETSGAGQNCPVRCGAVGNDQVGAGQPLVQGHRHQDEQY